ncbi:MAG: hypothetical protein NWF05_07880 [Candidatus Bathyarchaeota archaeon]|nr:hypothetical protein [Candidatus Bathyarchaeota archaeon]
MKHSSIIIVAGCLAALVLGLALAYPLLVMNLPVGKSSNLDVDVVYAYFGTPYVDANVSGLWRNYSIPTEAVNVGGTPFEFDMNVVAYFLVLNITNLSKEPVYITNFDTIIGPSISAGPNGPIQANNPIVTDSRNVDYYPLWNNIWSANASRLIFLSGMIGVHDVVYDVLNGTVWVHAKVEGHSYEDNNVQASGVDYKQISLQTFGDAHLYNNLIGEKQTLIFYNGLDVYVGTRLPS